MTETNFSILERLAETIHARKAEDSASSYTAKLLHGPLKYTAQKVAEEGAEVALAAVSEPDEALVSEMADLLFHLLVLSEHKGVAFSRVLTELERREGTSGLKEKASRKS